MIVEPIASDKASDKLRQSCQPAILQRLDDDLRSNFPGSRTVARRRRSGGRGKADERAEGGRLYPRVSRNGRPFHMVLEARP